MSDLIVDATRIKEIRNHANADSLELAVVKGWQIVVKKGSFASGDSVIHVPPDAMLKQSLAEQLGVWNYLSVKKGETEGRVKAVRLRGEMSFGFIFPNTANHPENENLKDIFGIWKWEPPPDLFTGDAERPHPLFGKYSDIQNLRNFPDIFEEGEEVIISEKIHGRSGRGGYIRNDATENKEYEFMAGSHDVRRKLGEKSVYETPLTDSVKNLLVAYKERNHPAGIIVFGEIFGYKMQDLQYGNKRVSFRAFDIQVNGSYIDYDEYAALCDEFNVDRVPVLYRGPFSHEIVQKHTNGSTTLMSENAHMREGVVIRPVKERTNPRIGRVILKSISDEYLLRRGGSEHH